MTQLRVRRLASAARREAVVRTSALRAEQLFRRAARTRKPMLLGPWLGEVGYELLYWVPFLRRELHRHGIDREQAAVLTRGGAAVWYRDFAARSVDALELLTPREYLPRLAERRRRAGDLKQLRVEPFDRELVALARARLGEVTVVHPGLMFTRMRGLWFKDQPLSEVWPRLEYRRLDVPVEALEGLPERYVAVKAYFNQCLSPTTETVAFLRRTLEQLAEEIDVVLLSTGLLVDDHEEWALSHPRVHPVDQLLRPEDNLAVQTRVVAGAHGLVATYGGFSYLGPFLGVPTLTFSAIEQTVPVHLDVLRAAVPDAAYEQVAAGDAAAVRRFASRLGR